MSWVDDLYQNLTRETHAKGTGWSLERTADPAIEPVSLEELQSHAYLSRASAAQLTDLALFLKAARMFLEREINKGLISQTWTQYYNRIHPIHGLPLYKGPYPVLEVVSVQYQANWSSDAWTTWSSANYAVSRGREIHARGGWPSFRDVAGIRVNYKVGYGTLPDPNDSDDVAAARNAVPEDLRKAIKDLAAFWFENREGQGHEAKYEAISKTQTALPVTVQTVIDTYRDRRFLS